jgi:hypothetical protein
MEWYDFDGELSADGKSQSARIIIVFVDSDGASEPQLLTEGCWFESSRGAVFSS